ncbi:oligosaccharide flippase family protein, partial [Escherichia coli]|uniref:oligosaccharide flippase family protein n=1 Tax=Escherichia coli TaxID=562 RepID=UPI00192A70A4
MLALSNYVAILFVLSKDFFINISYKVSLSNLHFFLQKDKKFIWFGILLIPHSLSQWVMSSSDRYIIKVFFNDTVLGEYSLAYAYASLFMLFISVLAITLPEYCIRKYDSFCKKRMLLMFMATMALVYIFGFISLYVVVLQYINFNVREINIFCIIYSSLFYLVMYHYCS